MKNPTSAPHTNNKKNKKKQSGESGFTYSTFLILLTFGVIVIGFGLAYISFYSGRLRETDSPKPDGVDQFIPCDFSPALNYGLAAGGGEFKIT